MWCELLFLVLATVLVGLLLQSETSYGIDTVCGVNGLQCPSNQVCQVVPDQRCTTQPCQQVAQCFPQVASTLLCITEYHCVIDYSTSPPEPKCVPTNPCDNVACPQFQQCYVEISNCSADPNQPQPVCAYSSPCKFVNCPNGTVCARTQEGNTPPTAQCVRQTDPCSGVQCPDLHKCFLRDVQCVRALCYPVPECAYYDPCMLKTCDSHYLCKVLQRGNNPPTAECLLDLDSLCADTVCPKLQKCYMEPCSHPPRPVCVYHDPCVWGRCDDGFKCVTMTRDKGDVPPTSTCVPDKDTICNGTLCPEGQKCYLQDVTCLRAPCLPVDTCAYSDPCSLTECSTGFSCAVKDNGDFAPTPECVSDPKTICALHECTVYQKCYLIDSDCGEKRQQPVCSYPDPCLFVKCEEGYNCVTVEEVPKPPTAYCLKNYDLCVGVNCTSGNFCYIKDTECTDFECYPVPPSAVCSLPDPCATEQCPTRDSNCVTIQRPRKNPPEARCLPKASPCDYVVCETNQLCYIKDYDCNQTTCYDIAPVGVCALPDPCVAVKCTQNTTCQVVQIRRNPPQPLCSPVDVYNLCDNFVCDQGFQCFVKDIECVELSCTAIDPQPVCSVPNPCATTTCAGGSGCALLQIRNNPPAAYCQPPQYLCDSSKCGTNEGCYIKDFQCVSSATNCSRLANPYPTCAPNNPCNSTTCASGSFCYNEQVRNNPPQPVCIMNLFPAMDCQPGGYNDKFCRSMYKACYNADVRCEDFSCVALLPGEVCAYPNPCSVTTCPANTTCTVKQKRKNPPEALCKPKDICDGITCATGEKCFIKDFECNQTGCSYCIQPKPVCAHYDPCGLAVCESGNTCLTQQIRKNPPFALCSPTNNPWDTARLPCAAGNASFVVDFVCDKYSCRTISPAPVCAPSDPCSETTWPDTTICISLQIRSNPPLSNCLSFKELCNRVQCVTGQKCYIFQVFCITAPCPPQPMCAPVDPCGSVTCLPGYTCVNRQYGVSAPFPDCVQLDDPCDGINCTDGQECFLREKRCRCPPCGYEPVCASPDPCILATCQQGDGCYPKRLARLIPVAVCYPVGSPCKTLDCLPGQGCTTATNIECKPDLPCPVPVCLGDPTQYLCNLAACRPGFECTVDVDSKPFAAKCVLHNGPCDSTICPSGSSCVVLNTYPPIGRCLNVSVTNPCSVVQCKAGYQCLEVGSDPAQAQCIPTCDICPPTTSCVTIGKDTPFITCQPNPRWLIT